MVLKSFTKKLINRNLSLEYQDQSLTYHGLGCKMIGLPVVIVAPERVKGNFMGWLGIYVPQDHTFSTIEEACSFINRRYKKEYERNHKYFELAIKKAAIQVNKGNKKNKK